MDTDRPIQLKERIRIDIESINAAILRLPIDAQDRQLICEAMADVLWLVQELLINYGHTLMPIEVNYYIPLHHQIRHLLVQELNQYYTQTPPAQARQFIENNPRVNQEYWSAIRATGLIPHPNAAPDPFPLPAAAAAAAAAAAPVMPVAAPVMPVAAAAAVAPFPAAVPGGPGSNNEELREAIIEVFGNLRNLNMGNYAQSLPGMYNTYQQNLPQGAPNVSQQEFSNNIYDLLVSRGGRKPKRYIKKKQSMKRQSMKRQSKRRRVSNKRKNKHQ